MALAHRAVISLLFCLIFAWFAEGQIHDPKSRTFFWKPSSGLFEFPVPNKSVNTKTTTKEKNHIANWTDFDGHIEVDIFVTPNVKEDPLTEEYVRSIGEKPTFLGKEQKGKELMKPILSKKGTPKLAEGCYSMEPRLGLTYYNVMVFAYYPKQQELYRVVVRIEKGRYQIPDVREHLRRIRFGPDVTPLPADVALVVPEPQPPTIDQADLVNWTTDDKKFTIRYPKKAELKEVPIPETKKGTLLYSMSTQKKDIQVSLEQYPNLDPKMITGDFLHQHILKTFKSSSGVTLMSVGPTLSSVCTIDGHFEGQRKRIAIRAVVSKNHRTLYVLAVAYEPFDLGPETYAKSIIEESLWADYRRPGMIYPEEPEPKNPTPMVPPTTPEPKNPVTPPTPKTPNPTPPKTENPPFNPGPTFPPQTPTPPNEKTSSTTANTKETTFWTTRNTVLIVGGGVLFLLGVGIGGVLLLVKMMKSKSEDDSDDEDDRPRKKSSSAKRNNRFDDEDNRPRNRPQKSGSSERSKSSQPPKKKRPVDDD